MNKVVHLNGRALTARPTGREHQNREEIRHRHSPMTDGRALSHCVYLALEELRMDIPDLLSNEELTKKIGETVTAAFVRSQQTEKEESADD